MSHYPREERVEAVDLLPLGDVSVVLSNALQSQLLHQVDLIGLLKVFGLQQLEGGGDKTHTVERSLNAPYKILHKVLF